MVYYFTKQTSFTTNSHYSVYSSLNIIYSWIKQQDEIGLDIETRMTLDFHSPMLLVQLGDDKDQFVINAEEFEKEIIELLLEYKDKTYIIQNAQFDLKFFIKRGVYLRYIFDTCVTEKVLTNGLGESAALDALSLKYLGEKLDKTIRTEMKGGISTAVILYAAKDVEVLPKIKAAQEKVAKQKDLVHSIYLQNKFVPVLAKMIVHGIHLDYDKWMIKANTYKRKLAELKGSLKQQVLTDSRLDRFRDKQLSLFEEVSCNINWASSKQIVPLMQTLGVDTKVKDKKTGKIKNSVESKHLDRFKNIHPLISIYLEYKEVEKELSTYGENWKNFIHPVSGRIHSNFNQYINTGRMSSGKDKSASKKFPNLQNIPADKETRACFTAQEGNIILSCDYSNQEGFVCAELSQDPVLKELFNTGGDLHCITGSAISHIFLGESQEVTKDNGLKTKKGIKIRDIAKIVNFAIQYLCQPPKLAENLGCELTEAQEIHKATIKKYQRRHDFFEEVFLKALETGYIEFNPQIRSKFFIKKIDFLRKIVEEFGTSYKNGEFYFNRSISWETKKEFSKIVSTLKRYCANYPIQGTSGDMTKIAAIYIDDWIEAEGYRDVVRLVNCVHDELLYEIRKDLEEVAVDKVVELMNKAADIFCKTVKLTADPAVELYWKK